MNNEEKILSILEAIRSEIARMDKNQAVMEKKLTDLGKRNDNVSTSPIRESLATLERGMKRIEADIADAIEDIEAIKEDATKIRTAANTLLDWAERSEAATKI